MIRRRSIFKLELIDSQTNEVIKSAITDSRLKILEDWGISTEWENINFSISKEDYASFRIAIRNDPSKYIMSYPLKTSTCESIIVTRKYVTLIRDIRKIKDCDWKSKLRAIRKYRGGSKKRNIKAFKEVISKISVAPYDWKDDMIEFISKNKFYRMPYGKIYEVCDVGIRKWAY